MAGSTKTNIGVDREHARVHDCLVRMMFGVVGIPKRLVLGRHPVR